MSELPSATKTRESGKVPLIFPRVLPKEATRSVLLRKGSLDASPPVTRIISGFATFSLTSARISSRVASGVSHYFSPYFFDKGNSVVPYLA